MVRGCGAMSSMLLLLFTLLLISPSLSKNQFIPPKYFFVLGERFSGASYLSELIRENTAPSTLVDCFLLHSHLDDSHHQHHQLHALHRRPDTHEIPKGMLDESRPPTFPRRAVVDKQALGMMQCPVEETMFIVITKNPYSWIASLVETKYKTKPRRSLVTEFVSPGGWIGENKDEKKIKSIMALRTMKLKSQLNMKNLPGVKHFKVVKYEDYLADAEQSLSQLLAQFGVPRLPKFKGVFHYVKGDPSRASPSSGGAARRQSAIGGGEPFLRYKYYVEEQYVDLFDESTMVLVNSQLDEDLEGRLGYEVPPSGFHIKHAKHRRARRGLFGTVTHYLLEGLWWIVAVVTLLLLGLVPLVWWLARSNEAKAAVERGDGLAPDKQPAGGAGPPPLAEGWAEAFDATSGLPYFFHKITKEVTWDRPLAPPGTVPPPVAKIPSSPLKKKNDDDAEDKFDEVAFNDALYSVAAQQVEGRNLSSTEEKEMVTHQVANKLRKRYQKKAMEGQSGGLGEMLNQHVRSTNANSSPYQQPQPTSSFQQPNDPYDPELAPDPNNLYQSGPYDAQVDPQSRVPPSIPAAFSSAYGDDDMYASSLPSGGLEEGEDW